MEADGFVGSDWLKSIGGVVFFVAGVLTWWELEYGQGLSTAFNGFDYRYTGILPYIIFVGIAILTIVIKTESLSLPRFLVDPVLTLGAAVIGTILVGYRFFADGYDNEALEAQNNSVERGIGLYLALAGAVLVLAGCVVAYRDQRVLDDDEDDAAVVDGSADATPSKIDRPPKDSSPPLP